MKVIKHCTGCFILGDTQNLMGCSPKQAALADPALNSVGLDDLQKSLPTSFVLWIFFCIFFHTNIKKILVSYFI